MLDGDISITILLFHRAGSEIAHRRMLAPLLVWLIVTASIMGCTRKSDYPFSLPDLLIRVTDLPGTWLVDSVSDDPVGIEHYNELQAVDLTFYFTGDPSGWTRGGMTVYRLSSTHKAAQAYAKASQFDESSIGVTTPISSLDDFPFQSQVANQWRVGCYGTQIPNLSPERRQCVFVAQYADFLTYFAVSVDYQGQQIINSREFARVVGIIDQRMQYHLDLYNGAR